MEKKTEDRPLVSAGGASGHLDYLVDLASGAGNAGEAKYSPSAVSEMESVVLSISTNLI